MAAPKQKLNDMLGNQSSSEGHGPADTAQPVDEIETRAPRTVYDANKTFDASETMTPRLVLAQGLSPEVRAKQAEAGQYLLMGHAPINEVSLVIAGHADQRRYVPQNEQVAACYSPDGIYGYGNPGTLPDGTHLECALCPLSHWTDSGRKDAQGRTINNPPPCNEVDSFVAFSVTHGMPVVFPLKGTGTKAARFIKTLCNGLGMGNFAVSLSSVSKEKPGRAWHEPVVRIDDEVTKEEAQGYARIALTAVEVAGAIEASAASPD